MARNDRISDPTGGVHQVAVLWGSIGLFGVLVLGTNLGVLLDRAVGGPAQPARDPISTTLGLFTGSVLGSPLVVGVAVMTAVVVAGVGVAAWRGRPTRRSSRVDHAARSLGQGADVAPISLKNAQAVARRLGVDAAHPGVPIGQKLGGASLWGSWEDMHIDVWGPRTGKTTSRAIPAIMAAPGSVLVTSNKRDVVDATRGARVESGPVWVFDPQGVANEEPTWWWNPLSYVTDEVKAAKLAGHFAAGSRDQGARTDAFFDPAGQDLLAGLLLAASLAEYPITQVYRWLTDPGEKAPVAILRSGGYPLTADQVEGVLAAPEKQRGGIYGTAQQMASCLTNRQVARWVNPDDADSRPQFNPETFVHYGKATLYSLSKEGKGNAGPLVTALTVAVAEAAEELASHSAGGRLTTPLLCVLDEAANVCRWAELPSLYSHFGSRGIILMTILQSWSQGVDVWGQSGMNKLWSAANVRVLGGGVDEKEFLEHLSMVLGDRDRIQSQVSYHQGRSTRTKSTTRERILEVADLAQLPRGRAVVFASGSRPVLIRTVPWFENKKLAPVITASIEKFTPNAKQPTLVADVAPATVPEGDDGQ